MPFFCRNHNILVKVKEKRKNAFFFLEEAVTEDRKQNRKDGFNGSSRNLSTQPTLVTVPTPSQG